MKRILAFIIAIVYILPVYSLAATINVPSDQPNIQAGIDATIDGDTVLIADGIYAGAGNYNINFSGKAITVASVNGPGNCIVDCQQMGRGFLFYSGETESSVLDGLTIRNGETERDSGGGVYVNGSVPSIINCVFKNNAANNGGAVSYDNVYDYGTLPPLSFTDCKFISNNASRDGGAVYSYSYSSPISFTNCTFTNNNAAVDGGAVYYYDNDQYATSPPLSFTDCKFISNNAAKDGGAVYSSHTLFSNCRFTSNSAGMGGGAVFSNALSLFASCIFNSNAAAIDGGAVFSYSSSSFTNCTFTNNNASDDGGAAYFTPPTLSEFKNCIFTGNTASDCGGAVVFNSYASSSFIGCIFIGNSADGGGAVFSYSAFISFTNCTFTLNEAFAQGGVIWCHIPLTPGNPMIFKNCILWGNTAPEGAEIHEEEKPLKITYSDIEGGHSGEGNINIAPLFVDADAGDLHLQYSSPCVDTGTPDGAPVDDLDGNPRPIGSGYDMGAYEFQTVTVGTPPPSNQSAWNYPSVANPVRQSNPADCKPFATGDLSSGNLSLQIGLPEFSSGVDVYLAIGFADALFLVDSSNALQSAVGLTTLPKWKSNNTAAINESLYGNIPTSLLPAGTYNLYVLVVPAGETNFSHYYFWSTSFNIVPTSITPCGPDNLSSCKSSVACEDNGGVWYYTIGECRSKSY